jgi:ComF family protein
MRLWLDAALSVLFAPQCVSCGEPLARPTEGAACAGCWNSILAVTPPLCECCGDALPAVRRIEHLCPRCCNRRPHFDRAVSAGCYEGALRDLIHAFKYDGRRSLSRGLAALIRVRCGAVVEACEIAVPVPLHPSKRRARGFNQADDLARLLNLPTVPALVRVRKTASQADLTAEAREENVSSAFALTAKRPRVLGRRVLLVDDVTTTGATLNACAAALRAGGASAVYAVTAARAVTKWR